MATDEEIRAMMARSVVAQNAIRLCMLQDEAFAARIIDKRRKPWPAIRKLQRALGQKEGA